MILLQARRLFRIVLFSRGNLSRNAARVLSDDQPPNQLPQSETPTSFTRKQLPLPPSTPPPPPSPSPLPPSPMMSPPPPPPPTMSPPPPPPPPPPPSNVRYILQSIGASVATVCTIALGFWGLYYQRRESPMLSETEAVEKLKKDDEDAIEAMKEKMRSTFSLVKREGLKEDQLIIDRSEEREQLKNYLKEGPDGTFIVWTGPHRAGKTTLMAEAVNELREEKVPGIVFVRVEEEPLGFTIAEALGFNHLSVLDPRKAESSRFNRAVRKDFDGVITLTTHRKKALWQVYKCLSRYAQKFTTSKGDSTKVRVTTVVIDGINNLIPKSDIPTTKDKEELLELQEIAKTLADEGTVRMIFIDSSGAALKVMTEASANSRMRLILAEDAVKAREFLKKHLQGTNVDADMAYSELTGGRVGLLVQLVHLAHSQISDGKLLSMEDVREKFLHEYGYAPLSKCDIHERAVEGESPKTRYMRRIVDTLLEKPIVYIVNIPKVTGCTPDDRKSAFSELLKADVIKYVSKTEVALHSQAVATALKDIKSKP